MNEILLEKGDYSGKVEKIDFFDGITISVTSYIKSSSSRSENHHHQNAHLSLVLTGQHLEKREKSEYERKPGDVLFCRAGESHHFLTGKESSNINIELDTGFLKENFIDGKAIEDSLGEIDAKLKILKIFHELFEQDGEQETSIKMLLLGLFHNYNGGSRFKPKWIESLDYMLKDNWNETLTLKNLSDVLGVHPVTISKYFSKYFNCSFGEYRRKIKISKSLEMIKNSSMSLAEIAYQSGFSDQSHYIRSFKSYTGFTPKAFKNI